MKESLSYSAVANIKATLSISNETFWKTWPVTITGNFAFPTPKLKSPCGRARKAEWPQSHTTCATFPDSNPRILFFFWLCLRTMIHLQQNYYCNVSKFISFQKLHLITGFFFKGVGRECHEVIFHYRAVVWLLWKKKMTYFLLFFHKMDLQELNGLQKNVSLLSAMTWREVRFLFLRCYICAKQYGGI